MVDFQVGVPPCFDSACPVCGSRAGWPGFAPARCPSTTAHATARRSRRTWLPPAPRTGRVLDPGRPPYMAATTSSQLVFPASPGQGTVAMGSLRTPRTAAAVLAIGAALLTGWPAAAFGITAVIAGAGTCWWVLRDRCRTRHLISLILAMRGDYPACEAVAQQRHAVRSPAGCAPGNSTGLGKPSRNAPPF